MQRKPEIKDKKKYTVKEREMQRERGRNTGCEKEKYKKKCRGKPRETEQKVHAEEKTFSQKLPTD